MSTRSSFILKCGSAHEKCHEASELEFLSKYNHNPLCLLQILSDILHCTQQSVETDICFEIPMYSTNSTIQLFYQLDNPREIFGTLKPSIRTKIVCRKKKRQIELCCAHSFLSTSFWTLDTIKIWPRKQESGDFTTF